MELIIRYLEPCHLRAYSYRGEGNANLVISLPLARSILRFRKIELTEEAPIDGVETRVLFEWRFFMKFVSKFMGRFVTPPEVIQCHPRDFADWDERVEILRPVHRKHKNSYNEFAIKLPDYAKLSDHLDVDARKPTFCIEIKPKQGFMPESERQTERCPYCIKQFHKISKRAVNKRSRYCPCDLFSGDKTRVHHAIAALIESPQNNLIIFREGEVVWGEGHPCDNLDKVLNEWLNNGSQKDSQQLLNELYELIAEAMYREFPLDEKSSGSGIKSDDIIAMSRVDVNHSTSGGIQGAKEKICNFPDGNLPEGSILGCLFRMQQLHSSSADHVYRIYSQHSTHLNEEIVYFSESCEYKSGENSIDFSDILILRNYLLFTTARDCSVLLTFREVDPRVAFEVPREHVITGVDQTFVFNIGLTDLDPKPLNRIDRHRRRAIKEEICVLSIHL
ncbi:inositol-pentakisphosphate 2-kinase isoform X2 [Diachasma alloeum]|uniref:inositol-pentakisphosphate 2-kinase isoform X2 n=1 Tax=Diachasma alloeum TaxID=454923 RepID=UPI0007385184|nr:inositol-pentakisphosphate 2-kinase isoform X2 [Diachasma alloeum]